MSDPVSLSSKRAEKSGDCRDATALDILRDLVADIEAGRCDPCMIYVAMLDPISDGVHAQLRFACAGGTRTELVGLLTRHVHLTCDDGN